VRGIGQRGDQRALEHAARMGGRRHAGQHQAWCTASAQPGQQRLRRLVLAVEAFEREAARRMVFSVRSV
jgi:hypothetical protein